MATIIGSNFQDLLQGTVEDDLISGGGGDDVVFGNAGNDIIFGRLGQDILDGGEGNDVLDGGDGDDVLNGGDGNDLLEGEQGNDIFIGSTGNDVFSDVNGFSTLDYTQLSEAITLQSGVVNKGSAGTDKLLITELVVIGPLGFANTIDPFTGLTIAPVSIDVDLSANRFTNKNIPGGGDFTVGVENFVNVIGGSLSDVIKGNDQDNVLIGGGGNDLFIATAGNDFYSGGDGIDTIDYTGLGQAITLKNARIEKEGGLGIDQGGGDGLIEGFIGDVGFANTLDSSNTDFSTQVNLATDSLIATGVPVLGRIEVTITNFVNVIGSNANDIITGNDADNQLDGGGGDDIIVGSSGTDTLTGGDGRDTFVLGEAGNVFYLGEGFAVITDFDANTDTIQLAGLNSFYSLFSDPVSGSVSISLDNGNGVFDADDDLIASVRILRGTFSSADHLIFA